MMRNGQAVWLLLLRSSLGLILLLSSIPKLKYPYDFLHNVYAYQMTGPRLSHLIGAAVPWIELLLGICLLSGAFLGGGLLASSILFTLFLTAQSTAVARALPITCGCFAGSSEIIGYSSLARIGALASLSFIAYIMWLRTVRRTSDDGGSGSALCVLAIDK